MSKILWKTLKLGSAVLGVSLLVAHSTLAAETHPGQVTQEQKSVATSDQPVDSLSSLPESTKEQQTLETSDTTSLKVNPKPVVTKDTLAQTNSDSSAASHLPLHKDSVVADKTLANKTPDSRKESIRLNATTVAQNTTDESALGAQEETNSYSNVEGSSDPMDQVTNVSQFSDVRPGDWAYEALRELVERYGCIAGYPDGTYRGNRAMTRYEFAAGLRACLNQIEKLIAAGTANFASKEDLEKLRRLTQEFQAELTALGTRVDKLEGRVSFLENHQFSTTTRLNAEVIFNVAGIAGERTAVGSGTATRGGQLRDNLIFSDRVRLNFDTSFTGKDRLRTRLEANNTTQFSTVTGTNESRLGYDGVTGTGSGNSVLIGKLQYRFPLTTSTTVFLDATGGEFYDNINTLNPYLESSGIGALSRFGRFNPIYRISNTGSATNTGAGATVVQKFGSNLSVSAGYLARRANDPLATRGLFDGTYAAIGQVNFQASKAFGLGLTYAHSYYAGTVANNGDVGVTGSTGSAYANAPFTGTIPTSANAYAVEASFRLSQFFTISGWGGLTYATAERSNATRTVIKGQHASGYNVGVTLAFPDLGRKGNLGALIFGIPPKLTGNTSRLDVNAALPGVQRRRDRDTSYHLEGLYRLRVTNNIYLTPGAIVILNPEHNAKNPTEYVGVLRTTFTF